MLDSKKFLSVLIPIILLISIYPILGGNNSSEVNNNHYFNNDNPQPYLPQNGQNNYEETIQSRGNEAVTFTNVSKQANISQFSGNYFAWGDYNLDGYQDLLVNGKKLLRNNGPPGWNFTDVTTEVNISYSGSINVGVWGDWNNDRYLDFFAAGGGWTTDNPTTYDVLWRNTGPPNYTFEDYTLLAGGVRDSYPSVSAGWGDYDQDGYLDLYIGNYEDTDLVGWPDSVWHNNGNETFSEVTIPSNVSSIDSRPARGVAWCDYNNDGWQDIYISNYRLDGNILWENQHDGTFKNVASKKNCEGLAHYYQGYGPYYGHTIGSAWGDLNNDGNMDIWVSNLVHKYVDTSDIRGYICDDSNLYLSEGGPHYGFKDIRTTAGIPTKPVGGSGIYQGDELWSGVAIGDFDNDGDSDVWVPQIYDLNYAPSFLFRNNNDGTFTDIAQSLGVRVYNNYGSAWCDYNNDGALDLITGGKAPFIAQDSGKYEIHLFENSGNSNNWIKLRLGGFLSNSKGIGAKIIVTTSQGTQYKQMEGGMGSHSQQNGLAVHFGIGSATIVTQLIVEWPNGRANIHNNIPVNQEIKLLEEIEGPKITSISVSNTDINEDDSINFDGSATDPDGTITRYEWDFDGDNNYDWSSTSNAKTSYKYINSGEYFAKLRVWDDSGRYYTFKSTDKITVNNVAPTAEAGNDIEAFEDENITFNANLSVDTASDLATLEYNWSFGDDTYSGWNQSPLIYHSYADNGIYNVVLQVRDDDYKNSTDTLSIIVINRIPSCEIYGLDLVAEDQMINFNAKAFDSYSDLPFIQYRWDFGDGNKTYWSSYNSTIHTFTEMGTYTIRCFVKDDDWPQDENFSSLLLTVYNVEPQCQLETDNSEVDEDEPVYFYGLANDTVSDIAGLLFNWDLGDGNTSGWLKIGYQNITHTYTNLGIYQANLIVRDNNNFTCKKMINITVNNPPPVCVVMEEDYIEINEDETISFYGSGTDTRSDKDLLEFSWDLGVLGIPRTPWNMSAEFEYTFEYAGEYTGVLTVRDDNNASDNATVRIVVSNVKPVARFLVSETTINEDSTIFLDASGTEDTPSDLKTINYTWKMDDGSTQKFGIHLNHTYIKSGNYKITLTVTDDDSEADSSSIKITVKNVKPTAVITISTEEVFIDYPITFNGNLSTDSPSDFQLLSYSWNFDDGEKFSGLNTTHSFADPGRYQVTLTVTDDDGASGVASVFIKIRAYNTGSPDGKESDDGSGMYFFGIIIAIVIIIIVLFIILIYIRGFSPWKGRGKGKDLDEKGDDKEIKPVIEKPSDMGPKQDGVPSSTPLTQPPPQPMAQQQTVQVQPIPGSVPLPMQIPMQIHIQRPMQPPMQPQMPLPNASPSPMHLPTQSPKPGPTSTPTPTHSPKLEIQNPNITKSKENPKPQEESNT